MRLTISKAKPILSLALVLFTLVWSPIAAAFSQTTVVRGILFYSPSCGHCQYVITEFLPPLLEQYGDQLQIIGVDTSTDGGQALFEAAILAMNVPAERQAVPMLIIGEQVLLGSQEIPNLLPGLVAEILLDGGIDWPAIPGLQEALADTLPEDVEGSTTATPTGIQQAVPPSSLEHGTPAAASLAELFARDLAGNILAVVVLLGMFVSVGGVITLLASSAKVTAAPKTLSWWIPGLCLVGIIVAAYLTYVETNQVSAVCGPVGDCNTVQQSEYARLFGAIPIGGLGLAGYALITIAWLVARKGTGRAAFFAALAVFGMSFSGVLFSIYLTYLEPFVIGATCMWCLSSALVMTALMWLSVNPGKQAYLQLGLTGPKPRRRRVPHAHRTVRRT